MSSNLLNRSKLRSCTRQSDKWIPTRRQRSAVCLAAALLVGVIGGCSGGGGGAAGGNNGGGDALNGAPTWAKSYGGPARDQATGGMQRPGGGYVFVGSVNNRGSGSSRYSGLFEPGYESDLWVTTLDEYGDIEWHRSYGRVSTVPTDAPADAFRGGVSYERVRAAIDSEADGQRNGVWLAGYVNLRERDPEFQSTRYVEHGTDLIVTRLDADNHVVFSRSYDSGAFPLPYSFTDEQTSEATGSVDIWPTGDGGLLVAADATAAVRANGQTTLHGGIFVLKIDAAGEPQWSMLFRPEGAFGTRSELLVRELQGGAVLAYDLGSGMQIVRVDAGADRGSIRWRRTYENDERPADLIAVDDDDDGSVDALAIGGTDLTLVAPMFGDQTDGFVIKLDLDGDELWRNDVGLGVSSIAASCPPGLPCRYAAAGVWERDELRQGFLRVMHHEDGDTIVEASFPTTRSAGALRYVAAQNRYQMIVALRGLDSPHAIYGIDPVTLDRLSVDAIQGLPASDLIGQWAFPAHTLIVPDVSDDFVALASGPQQLYLLNQLGNASQPFALETNQSALERGFAIVALASEDGRSENGFAVAGRMETTAANGGSVGETWVLRLASSGEIVWQKRLSFRAFYGRPQFSQAADLLRPTQDGGFVLAGAGAYLDARLLKLTAEGDVAWTTRDLSPDGGGVIRAIRVLPDGGYAVAGEDLGSSFADRRSPTVRAWVARLDENGTVQWHHRYSGLGAEEPAALGVIGLGLSDLRVTSDGAILLAGYATPNLVLGRATHAAVAIKLDAQGQTLWANSYPFGQSELLPNVRIAAGADQGFALAATVKDSTDPDTYGLFNVLLIKIGADGAVQWSQSYGGLFDEVAYGLESLSDGGYLVSAQSDSLGDYSEAWLLRVGPDGRIVQGCNADLGRGGAIARTLPVTREDYELSTHPVLAEPISVSSTDTDLIAAEPAEIVTARQCSGFAANDPGALPEGRTLSVNQAGSISGVVTSVPQGIVCGTLNSAGCSAEFATDTLVALRVDFGSIEEFSSWGEGCETVRGGFSEICDVRMDTDKTIDVIFGAAESPPPPPPPQGGEQFTLTMMIDHPGGFVGSTDGSFSCGRSEERPLTCTVEYAADAVVALYAAGLPGRNVMLEAWDGDCEEFDGELNISLTMNRDYSCRAIFSSIPVP